MPFKRNLRGEKVELGTDSCKGLLIKPFNFDLAACFLAHDKNFEDHSRNG